MNEIFNLESEITIQITLPLSIFDMIKIRNDIFEDMEKLLSLIHEKLENDDYTNVDIMYEKYFKCKDLMLEYRKRINHDLNVINNSIAINKKLENLAINKV